jgi:hypothetical protein
MKGFMMARLLTSMPLESWRPTRDTLQGLSRILGEIRQANAPREPHWFHISLHLYAQGLLTPTITAGDKAFEVRINLTSHRIELLADDGGQSVIAIPGRTVADLVGDLRTSMDRLAIKSSLDWSRLDTSMTSEYDVVQVQEFWRNLSAIHDMLTRFKATLRGHTGPLQLWPHHFDLAFLWFSGRQVPGQDPADEDASAEQMNFGFSTGDEEMAEPYFYVTMYPFPDGMDALTLPAGAHWNTSWKGAVLPLATLSKSRQPQSELSKLLKFLHQEALLHMR